MEFIRCVEATLLGVGRSPRLYPTVHRTYRRALVRRFPFAVFFEIDDELGCCVVYAVFHCSQEPGKWRSRVTK